MLRFPNVSCICWEYLILSNTKYFLNCVHFLLLYNNVHVICQIHVLYACSSRLGQHSIEEFPVVDVARQVFVQWLQYLEQLLRIQHDSTGG